MFVRCYAVDFSDEQTKTSESTGQSARNRRAPRFVFGEKHVKLTCAATDIGSKRTVDQDHQRSDCARRPASPIGLLSASRPAEDRAVRICRVRCGEENDFGLVRRFYKGPQEIERCRQRKLRGTHAGDEVTTSNAAGVFHRFQHVIDGAESPGNSLRRGHFARHDAIA